VDHQQLVKGGARRPSGIAKRMDKL